MSDDVHGADCSCGKGLCAPDIDHRRELRKGIAAGIFATMIFGLILFVIGAAVRGLR